jgi:uncharacterized protein YjbI with pentapeptide repeats
VRASDRYLSLVYCAIGCAIYILCLNHPHDLPKNMPKIIALIFVLILLCFPSQAIAKTPQYNPPLSYSNAELGRQDFSGQKLQKAEFSNANLDSTNFSGADLTGAVLSASILNRTNLHGANLTQSFLDLSRLDRVDLSDAILVDALMLQSTFKDVNITGADFSGAILDRLQQKQLCQIADGVNPTTGISTRDSLECK